MWPRRFTLGARVATLVAATLGVWLRLYYAGLVPLPLDALDWRHAHSHAGVYAVLFPLTWLAWRRAGLPVPGPRTTALYFFSCAVATLTFAVAGYALPSIVASAVIAAIWLFTAWSARGVVRVRHDALRLAPVAIVLSTAFIPAIAATARRAPMLASQLVHGFLSILFFLVVIPAALAHTAVDEPSDEPGSRPPPARRGDWDARLIGPLGLGAALHLGPLPHFVGAVALALFGGVVAYATRRMPRWPRALWLAFALGGLAMLAFPNGPPPTVAVAGLHFLLLGPVFVSFANAQGLPGLVAGVSALGMGGVLAVDVVLPSAVLGAHAHTLAAIFGVVWAVAAVVILRPREEARRVRT
ncbi:MAG: hypothetical protein H6722_26110 [Sandaracinus sp.]|nr:hypothetical protein [Sandaracinus sp.]MCB9615925.1 hypothetical protein [Sandaracinus sp.]